LYGVKAQQELCAAAQGLITQNEPDIFVCEASQGAQQLYTA